MKRVMIAAALTIVAGSAAAQRESGLNNECRREVVTLCGTTNLRECLRGRIHELGAECRQEIVSLARNRGAARAAAPANGREIAFGADPLQRFDFYAPPQGRNAPVILFLHGGGWSIGDKRFATGAKPAHFNALGYAFVSVNYRLVPAATVEDQAADIAVAIAKLRGEAGALGIDADRIVLMGHSAGAHLAALVGSDDRYLRAAGVPVAAVRGVVLLDGAGYDVPAQIANPRNQVQQMYTAAFGTDPARQRALSPITHAAAPNAAAWLILPVATRADSSAQSQALAAALRTNGSRATVTPVPDSNHAQLNRQLGVAGDFATAQVDAFLAERFGG